MKSEAKQRTESFVYKTYEDSYDSCAKQIIELQRLYKTPILYAPLQSIIDERVQQEYRRDENNSLHS